jgi:DHA2 family multidrug resistance protein
MNTFSPTIWGMDAVAASRAATGLLGKAIAGQSTVIAFDTAFNAVALLFVIAAPVLIVIKIGLSRYARTRVARSPAAEEPSLMPHSARPNNAAAELPGVPTKPCHREAYVT